MDPVSPPPLFYQQIISHSLWNHNIMNKKLLLSLLSKKVFYNLDPIFIFQLLDCKSIALFEICNNKNIKEEKKSIIKITFKLLFALVNRLCDCNCVMLWWERKEITHNFSKNYIFFVQKWHSYQDKLCLKVFCVSPVNVSKFSFIQWNI